MACLGVRSTVGVTGRVVDRVKAPVRAPSRISFPNQVKCSAAIKVAKSNKGKNTSVDSGGGAEKFDRWMRESVGEIVKNLQEAPLFVHVYGGDELKAERAVEEEWAHLKTKWVKGEEPSPEGVILVEELKEGNMGIFDEDKEQNVESTKAWGVLIQGKGEDGGVACYLLKTSKVGCSDLGLFCTHYCLVKVKSFRETARSQLTSCWLG